MDEASFRRLISGEQRGASATLLRGGLSILSVFYGLSVAVRNRLFDSGWKRVYRAQVPVISIGNITTGGTGKTPIVAFLANWFREQGIQPCILSRGYRSIDGAANDEKRVLDALCPNVPHLQNPDRVASARQACAEHDCQVLILDDGFQHRRLARDLNIVLIDSLHPWGYGRLLPRGLLREPVTALRRADFLIVTRADQCTPVQRQEIAETLDRYQLTSRVLDAVFRPRRLFNVRGDTAAVASLSGRRVAAFCGIGNPDGFWKTLTEAGMDVVVRQPFPDHHHYSSGDLKVLASKAVNENVAAIVTTQKDLVKLAENELNGRPLWAVEIGAEFAQSKLFIDALNSLRQPAASSDASS